MPQEAGIKVKNHSSGLSGIQSRDFNQLLQGISGESALRLSDITLKEFSTYHIGLLNKVTFVTPLLFVRLHNFHFSGWVL